MKIAIGSDHGGFQLKEHLRKYLTEKGMEVTDCGTFTSDSCDYPDFAAAVCQEVTGGKAERGVLVCGTGIGVSISANKCHGIRAALCDNVYSAEKSREHNDANVMCLGARVLGVGLAELITDTFFKTDFAGGRHQRRVNKIMALEHEQGK
jgi:ribose 5-phosphate isomerase B